MWNSDDERDYGSFKTAETAPSQKCTTSYVWHTISYVDMRHRTCKRCRIRYEPVISYVMYIRHRMSISDIRHCIRYVEMTTYDVVCVTYDVVCWRTTLYVTYDVARAMSYVYILYIARTTSHVRCTTRCRMLHVRHRTSCTYDIVYTYDIVGGKNPDDVNQTAHFIWSRSVRPPAPTSLSRTLGLVLSHNFLPHGSLLHSQTTQAWLATGKVPQPRVDLIHVAATPNYKKIIAFWWLHAISLFTCHYILFTYHLHKIYMVFYIFIAS